MPPVAVGYTQADIVIELGGRMLNPFLNQWPRGSNEWVLCRRYWAFIDQMSTLLNISPDEMNELAKP